MNKIIQGDCNEVMMYELDKNSIDTVITDPPYGLKFMGKKWDYDVPNVDTFKNILRVTKPGGTMLCFAGSRTQHRMAVNIEDAGWILKDCTMWLYGSGFPKATDISKQLDKGKRKLKPIDKTAKTKYHSNAGNHRPWMDDKNHQVADDTPVSEEAQLWNGWKSHGLKPAYEPIIVAMKPNDGTYANNALKHGVSGLNIDGGRIEGGVWNRPTTQNIRGGGYGSSQGKNERIPRENMQGRFPSNIILDEEAGKMLDEQSGVLKISGAAKLNKKHTTSKNSHFGNSHGKTYVSFPNDKGGASRFFYCAKASKAERNMGCEGLEEKDPAVMEFRPTLKTNPENWKTLISETPYGRGKPMTNNHPTVKPLKLMEYLCTLTKTPTGGIVLDPFAGSGTTLLAAKNTGRDCIGIEMDEEYIKICKARLK